MSALKIPFMCYRIELEYGCFICCYPYVWLENIWVHKLKGGGGKKKKEHPYFLTGNWDKERNEVIQPRLSTVCSRAMDLISWTGVGCPPKSSPSLSPVICLLPKRLCIIQTCGKDLVLIEPFIKCLLCMNSRLELLFFYLYTFQNGLCWDGQNKTTTCLRAYN